MVTDKIRKMSIKGVKLKSESFFSISPGVLEIWRKNLRGADSAPPVQIGLKAKTTRHYAEDIGKTLVVVAMMSVPGPFNGYHEMRHNSAVTHQNQLEFWNQKAKQIFSWHSKSFDP